MRELKLKPSRRLGLAAIMLGSLASVAIMLADLPVLLQAGLMIVACAAVVRKLRQAANLPHLALADDGGLFVRTAGEAWQEVTILPDSLVSTALVVLRYRQMGERARTLVLLPDSAGTDDLRRLRVSLRWARHTRSDTSSRDAG